MKLLRTFVAILILPLVSAHAQTKRALLIGIDHYNNGATTKPVSITDRSGTRFELDTFPDLEGSVNDAATMREMLVGKFGFAPANVQVLTAPAQTTDAAILAAMNRYLVDEPKSGDTVVFYYAGHGSQRTNSLSSKEGKLDNTLVGSDANAGAFDVLDRDIATVLNRAADKGVRITAIYDSCHSGTIARGIPAGSAGRVRYLGYDPRDIAKPSPAATAPEDRKDHPVLVFSATGPDQLANEWKGTDEPHGAFTTALLDALRELPPNTPARDIYQRVAVIMQGMTLNSEQQPFLSRNARADEPLFGAVSGPHVAHVFVTGVQSGVISLDWGYLNNIGKGTVLTSPPASGKTPTLLRVTRVDGPGHSTATLISPVGAKIETGDIFQISTWASSSASALQLWIPPSMDASHRAAALAAVETLRRSPQIHWISDPITQPAQFRLEWDGSAWILHDRKTASPTNLGSQLDAKSVLAHLPPGATLLAEIPPDEKFSAQLQPRPEETISSARSIGDAAYLLVGTASEKDIRYAWIRKDVITLGVAADAAAAGGKQATCSKNSAYPIRTSWVTEDSAGSEKLHSDSASLAKVHGWLSLPTPPDSGEPFPFHLRLSESTGKLVVGDEVPRNAPLHFVFDSPTPVPLSLQQRSIYVLDIDCEGAVSVLLGKNKNDKLPDLGSTDQQKSFDTPVINFDTPPFGRETFVLLTTSTPLYDLSVLSSESVVGGERGIENPLAQLLHSTATGTRGPAPSLPPDWSVEFLQVHATQ